MEQIKKWDTWFSANIWPIDFKQRPNCSSLEAWFACLRRDDCVSISQSTSGSFTCPISIRNGMASATEMSVAAWPQIRFTDRCPYSAKGAGSTERCTNKPYIRLPKLYKHRIFDVRGRPFCLGRGGRKGRLRLPW